MAETREISRQAWFFVMRQGFIDIRGVTLSGPMPRSRSAAAASPAPALRSLAPLSGKWRWIAANPSEEGPRQVRGRVSFEWLEGGRFLVMRSTSAAPFPSGISIIGMAEGTQRIVMNYFDSRGVARIYRVRLARGVLKIWRYAPGFSQRFTGRFAARGTRIEARWEKSTDGKSWEHDFEMTYTR
jgi:hypothetical protein